MATSPRWPRSLLPTFEACHVCILEYVHTHERHSHMHAIHIRAHMSAKLHRNAHCTQKRTLHT